MEAGRLDVDDWLLDYVGGHKFSARDFYEKKEIGIRLTLKLTPLLTETVRLWSEQVGPVVMNITKKKITEIDVLLWKYHRIINY
jgi:hypothetical protein